MGGAKSKLIDELFAIGQTGVALDQIDIKIEELKKEFKPEEWKLS